ncbi:ABC transporter C family member 13 [Tanacetum coccineum]
MMSSLMNIVPQKAILADSGKEVNANHVEINTRVAVKAGTMIPIDGVVVEGNCEVGAQALTGESFRYLLKLENKSKRHVGANHSSNSGVGREGLSIRLKRVAMSYRDNLDPLNLNNDLKIYKALKKCHIEEEVRAVRGLDMQMKESGNSFLVGQRQLLCLARAFLKSTMVTSSKYTQTAAKLKDAISSECKGLRVITIAHSISTILHMDNVLVLDEGVLNQLCSRSVTFIRSHVAHLNIQDELLPNKDVIAKVVYDVCVEV